MVMRKTITRVGVAEAKAELSRVLRDAAEHPTVIHRRGRDIAVVVGVEEYERLVANDVGRGSPMANLVRETEALKQRFGGGVDPGATRLDYESRDPFAEKRKSKR
jgi:prevent-host-death family protein